MIQMNFLQNKLMDMESKFIGTKGKRGRGRYTLWYIKQVNKDLLFNPGDATQSLITIDNEKESEKEQI